MSAENARQEACNWKVRLVFSRTHEQIVELPGTLSRCAIWRHVRHSYQRCAIHVLQVPDRPEKL
jgi:hypothetical protein